MVRWCWHTLLIPALRRQKPVDLWEFKASLVYRASFRAARAVTQRNPVSKKKKKLHKKKQKKKRNR